MSEVKISMSQANWRHFSKGLSEQVETLRTENERLKGEVEKSNHAYEVVSTELTAVSKHLAHHKQLLVERDRVLGVAKEALSGVLNSAVHPEKAIRSIMVPLDPIRNALSQINKVLEVPK